MILIYYFCFQTESTISNLWKKTQSGFVYYVKYVKLTKGIHTYYLNSLMIGYSLMGSCTRLIKMDKSAKYRNLPKKIIFCVTNVKIELQ